MNILASISGGRSSAMMSYILHNHPKYKDDNKVFVFANTGMERPETIEFLKNCEKHWGINIVKVEGVYSETMGVGVGYKVVEWDELAMNAEPFDGAIMQLNKGDYEGLPHSKAPYCSDYLKTRPIQKFAKEYFKTKNFVTSIGFRAEDMPKRISWPEIKAEDKRIYPLLTDFEKPIGQRELTEWWQTQPFELGIHSKFGNCELCWKKSDRNIVETIQHGTRFVDWWAKHEQTYGHTSFRGNKSIHDYVKMAQQGTPMEFDFDQEDFNCMC
jgi:hypothetical protein